ncbi:sulfotransferase [Pseudohalioglobus sediminis]|uniref:Sulfotransferase n=1 Tax=Pseudohalioglobus sediminis TaxID=2606449 RepID=A0A5B0WQX1_9GAMM|nr:sulfotransferase [Pseudohalioglobus sediminis]KAA1189216.1 sulfotransferase [Pseudohalioglobus sediminis]
MTDLALHVGMSKTGTSTLQRALFRNHSQVFYLGKYVPSKTPKGCRTEEVYQWLQPLLWDLKAEVDVDTHRQFFNSLRAEHVAQQQIPVCSWEALALSPGGLFSQRLERLQRVCGDIKVQFTLRNPASWITSSYLQELQGNFTKRKPQTFGRNAYIGLEDWIELHVAKRGGLGQWLNYAANIRIASELLGRDKVAVLLFEDLVADADNFYRDVANFLGIDAEQCVELARGYHYNKRLTEADVAHMQSVQASLPGRMRWLLSSQTARRKRMAENSATRVSTPARMQLDAAWVDKVADATREGHQYLSEAFQLNLRGRGYPL